MATTKKKAKKPAAVIDITHKQLKKLCPAAYDEWMRYVEEYDDATPIKDVKFWLSHYSVWSHGRPDDPTHNLVPAYPGYSLNLQDPADDGFTNVSLIWDGEMWG